MAIKFPIYMDSNATTPLQPPAQARPAAAAAQPATSVALREATATTAA